MLGKLLDEKCDKNKDKPFLYFDGETISYGALKERVNRVANGLARMGIKKGDKVFVMMENCPEFIYTWFALSELGAIEVPVNIAHKGSLLEYLINYSDAETLVISENLVPQVKAIENNLQNLKKVIVHGSIQGQAFEKLATEPYQSLLDNTSSSPQVDVKHNDLMAIMFTSGTTGPSKGVMITHNQAAFVASQYINGLKISDNDLTYAYIPLFHMAAQFGVVIAALLSDTALVLKKGLSATDFWDDIRRYGCTISGLFEAVMKILSKAPRKDDDAENPIRVFATAHVPAEIHEPFEKRFGVKLVNVFGQTEGDCTVSATYDDIKVGSFGKPRGYFDVRIFDPDGEELPPNQGRNHLKAKEISTSCQGRLGNARYLFCQGSSVAVHADCHPGGHIQWPVWPNGISSHSLLLHPGNRLALLPEAQLDGDKAGSFGHRKAELYDLPAHRLRRPVLQSTLLPDGAPDYHRSCYRPEARTLSFPASNRRFPAGDGILFQQYSHDNRDSSHVRAHCASVGHRPRLLRDSGYSGYRHR